MRKVSIKYFVFGVFFIYAYLFMALPSMSYDKVEYHDEYSFRSIHDDYGMPIHTKSSVTERFLVFFPNSKMPKMVYNDFIKGCYKVEVKAEYIDRPTIIKRFDCNQYLQTHMFYEFLPSKRSLKKVTITAK